MNKEISRSPKKHEFLLNLAKSPTLSIDQYDFLSVQPHSKDSVNDADDQPSFHHERLATATDYISGKQPPIPTYFPHSNKSHLKKTSFDHQKDSVTYYQSPPATTTNAKSSSKSSQSRGPTRSNASQHLNFLNSKEFAKFALSKVLPRDLKRERGIYVELSPPQHGSKGGSLEKRSPKAVLKEESSKHPKLSAVPAKKQKAKLRASNLTSHDFSSVLDQTRHIHSFINSPQRRNPVQIYLPSTKSTANLRPMSTKNVSHNSKTAWQQASSDAFKKLESSQNKKTPNPQHPSTTVHTTEDSRPKERNKGIQSIASILNLRRDKKLSPDQKINSCYPVSNYHRKVLSTGCGAQNSACSQSTNYPPTAHLPVSQTASVQEDFKNSVQRSQSHVTKSSLSPSKRDPGSGKTKIEEESRIMEQEIGSEHFMGLQQTFEELLEKFKGDIDSANESYSMLRKIKEAYQVLATEVFSRLESQKEGLSQEDKGLKARCDRLAQEKMILEEEVKYLRMDNQRLQTVVSERRSKSKEREESKRSEEDHMESLLTNKHDYGRYRENEEIEELRRLVVNQQNEINELRHKESKLLELIYSIHKKGFNVTQFINEEVSRNSEHFEPNFLGSSKRYMESRKEYTGRERENPMDVSDKMEMGSLVTSGELSGFVLPDSKDFRTKPHDVSDARTSDGTPYLLANSHQALSGMLKNKLKLDFTGLPNNQKNLKLQLDPNNVHQQPDNAEPLGFHDEFMAKLEEFSLSWRQEALNQRKGEITDSWRKEHKDLMNMQS